MNLVSVIFRRKKRAARKGLPSLQSEDYRISLARLTNYRRGVAVAVRSNVFFRLPANLQLFRPAYPMLSSLRSSSPDFASLSFLVSAFLKSPFCQLTQKISPTEYPCPSIMI